MAITQVFTGNVSVSTSEISFISGNTTLQSNTTTGVYQLIIDVSALASGDSFRVRIKEKAISSSTQNNLEDSTIAGPQSSTLYVTPSLILMNGWDMTIVKVGGTDRNIPYSIRQVA